MHTVLGFEEFLAAAHINNRSITAFRLLFRQRLSQENTWVTIIVHVADYLTWSDHLSV